MPRLAESWEDKGDGTFRFHLRPDVTFSDGTAFDATDVAHSIERTLSPDLTCEIGAKYFGGMTITPTVVDDPDHRHQVRSRAADPAAPDVDDDHRAVGDADGVHPRAGRHRPLRALGMEPRPSRSSSTGRDDYWGDEPAVTKATYLFRSDDAVRAAMVETGEADIVPLISQTDATNPKTDFSYPNSETTYLRIDTSLAPLDDIRGAQGAEHGGGPRRVSSARLIPEAATIATHMTPPTTLGADEALPAWEYDPEAAKTLLEEAKGRRRSRRQGKSCCSAGSATFPNVTEVMEAFAADVRRRRLQYQAADGRGGRVG